jgi:hypothetical protein
VWSDRLGEQRIVGEAEASGARVSRRSGVDLVALVLLLLAGGYWTMQGNLLGLLDLLHDVSTGWSDGATWCWRWPARKVGRLWRGRGGAAGTLG